jgi:hypothetical protein
VLGDLVDVLAGLAELLMLSEERLRAGDVISPAPRLSPPRAGIPIVEPQACQV